ncbi:MAG: glycosidase [Phycisphaerae bacterium]|jgi:predicted GH43/DUF377 family glycosyl hydrolase
MKLERYQGNPILAPAPGSWWESTVTTNPAAYYDEKSGEILMLYRAAGNDVFHKIHFGLAKSTDGYNFEKVSSEPVFSPSGNGYDSGCVEDPRIVKIGRHFYITYASRFFPPGEYWLGDKARYKYPKCPEHFPKYMRENSSISSLVITEDFKSFVRAGVLTDLSIDDRDVIIFPEKVNGKYVMLHRPSQWCGNGYGTQWPAIWISMADDLFSFRRSKLLMKAEYEWELKIGGSTPPIKTKYGWFALYHAVGPDNHYRLGAFLLDLNDPSKVLYRTPDWLIEPQEDYELDGYYKGCIFPCGTVVLDDQLFVYYGGADKYVALATCCFSELLEHLLSCPAQMVV